MILINRNSNNVLNKYSTSIKTNVCMYIARSTSTCYSVSVCNNIL